MPRRNVWVRLNDMLSALDDGAAIVSGLSFDEYQKSVVVRRAVERCVEILSEASRHLPQEMKDERPNVF